MSQPGNFFSGFLLGTVVGGVTGGILGVLVSSRLAQPEGATADGLQKLDAKSKKRQIKAPTEQSIETARRGLEDKIAQLNDAIDDVRHQLGSVNGNLASEPSGERSISQEP
ncbi:MAG: hypothetical protein MUF49_28250 [Oculatellaceae cyanobacterium Prado106]|jgi:hypothetical protein|nr:hypothetical protein [Oculatellaceae cyanobacterium Prado106]